MNVAVRGRLKQVASLVFAVIVVLTAGACSGGGRSADENGATTGLDSGPGLENKLASELQSILDEERERFQASAASAAIVVPGEGVWTGASGTADIETEAPVTPETAFAVGSVTKTFVAALVLDLVEDDVLLLDDSLARWLPGFPRAQRITIRQLLNHTTGVFNMTDNRAFIEAQIEHPRKLWSPARTLTYVGEPLFSPGSDWAYSNTNYILLGLVIERATGSTVARELRRRLLAPAGVDAVFMQAEERVRAPVARGYDDVDLDGAPDDLSDGTRTIPNTALASAAWTAGGIAATPEAVARFGDALFGGRLLSRDSLRQMTDFDEELGKGRGGGLGYGFGLSRFEIPGHEVFGHGGGIPGYRSALWHVRDQGITIAFSWNDGSLDPTLVVQPLLDAVVAHLTPR
jgi:D-alanyl-D-alanine carboxypeptidase